MFFVSSRRGLENEHLLGRTETVWEVAIVGGRETRRRRTTWAELKRELAGKRVLLLVHGYNNEFEDVVRAYHIVESKCHEHLADHYDVILGYTWPGGDAPWQWHLAKRRSSAASPRLAGVLQRLAPRAEAIDLMTHSLGARVALKAADQLDRGTLRILYLLAAAVDNESIERGATFYRATQNCQRVFVFHSRHDAVLKYAYAAAQWDAALGLSGPEDPADIRAHSPNVVVVNCKHKIRAHGQYKYSDAVYRLIASALAGDALDQFITL
ncbi:MAG TPA: alpha/beta hydrolase [Planctomycetaceae bacterium]|nr:alpha/beta hydrolase [Planctomycetaceae bacterium]HIQ20648.1 alpha/beta hydrolase [Planctomycetota bacterium]